MEFSGIGSFVKIEIAPKNLIGPLSREDHLDAHGLDPTHHQEHGSRGSDARNVIGFDVVDDVAESIQPFLYREDELVMDRADGRGHCASLGYVRRAFEPDTEGMKARPPCRHFVAFFNPVGRKTLRDGRNDRRV